MIRNIWNDLIYVGWKQTFLFADYAKGFGGKFGVETDKVDKSAVGFEYQGKTERHESQKGQWRWKRVQLEPEPDAAGPTETSRRFCQGGRTRFVPGIFILVLLLLE